jgi:hypothetical protein
MMAKKKKKKKKKAEEEGRWENRTKASLQVYCLQALPNTVVYQAKPNLT